jgi:hypothetical protein
MVQATNVLDVAMMSVEEVAHFIFGMTLLREENKDAVILAIQRLAQSGIRGRRGVASSLWAVEVEWFKKTAREAGYEVSMKGIWSVEGFTPIKKSRRGHESSNSMGKR